MHWHDFIQQQPVTHVTDPDRDSLCGLASLAVLRLTGDDRLDFLHAQLTRDMHKLAMGQAGLAAWCNPKGRVIATFLVIRADNCIDLLVAADLKEAVLKRLRMFVLRARVEIQDCSDMAVAGVAGQALEQATAAPFTLPADEWQTSTDSGRCIRLPGSIPRVLMYADNDTLQALWSRLADRYAVAGEALWSLLNIEARLPWITQVTSEQFLPQMLNLDLSGGLDFNKGCYPGQEIVARLHYRGAVKQRLHHGTSEQTLAAGDTLYGAGGERAGDVVNAAAHVDGRYRCLAVTNIDSGRLHLGNADGPVVDIMP